MNEQELTRQLQAAGASVTPRPDLAEVELGAGRVRARRRVGAGVVAAMLVAAAGGAGFGIGRSVSDNGDQLAGGATVVDESTTTTTTSENQGDIFPGLPTTTTSGEYPSAEEAADQSYDRVLGDEGGYYEPQPMTLVYERTLENGIRVRFQTGQSWGDEGWYGSDWQPAKFCWPTRESRITLDGPDIVDVTGYGWYDELFKGLAAQASEVGFSDDHPMRILQIQAAPDVTRVSVTWSDGATDETDVVNGAAVLVADGFGAYEPYTLEVTDANGTRTMTNDDFDYNRDPDYRAGCEEPPPPLPDAGDQPADPAAAEAAIGQRFDILWDRTLVEGDKPTDLLDDRTGVDEAIAQVFEGGFAEAADSATHTIEELVFTSPSEAWFRYSIDSINGHFGPRFGYANLVDGVWVFPEGARLPGSRPRRWYVRAVGPGDLPSELVRPLRRGVHRVPPERGWLGDLRNLRRRCSGAQRCRFRPPRRLPAPDGRCDHGGSDRLAVIVTLVA